jgi:transcriptional regulator with XRE-family HTH domain
MNKIKNSETENEVFQRILCLLKKQNKTQASLIAFLDVHPNTFHQWKYMNSKGYLKRIDDIADYLNVTPGYLLKGNTFNSDVEGLTPREIKVLELLRKMDDEQQDALLQCIEKFV